MNKDIKLRQLLSRRVIADWLDTLIMMDDSCCLAIFQRDGQLFVSAGAWEPDMLEALSAVIATDHTGSRVDNYRLYPLHKVGVLAVNDAGKSTITGIAQSTLELLLNEALEKLDLADEALEGYREINLLYRIGETISATLDSKRIPGMVLEQSLQIIDAHSGVVILFTGESWKLVATSGRREIPHLDEIIAYIHKNYHDSQQPAIITESPAESSAVSSMLWAPMTTVTNILGGILLMRQAGKGVFIAGEEKLLTALARQAAVAVNNAGLFEDTHTYAQHLQQLNQISREISSSLDVKVVIERILDSALDLLHAEAGTLFLIEEPTRDLVFSVVKGGVEDLEGTHLPAGTGIVGEVADSRQAQLVNRVHANESWFQGVDQATGFVTQSIIAIPMVQHGVSIGVLELMNKRDGSHFENRDIVLLENLAAQATVALENARLHQSEVVKQRLERELQLGFEMQSGLIPKDVPALSGWEFAAWWQPARKVSGDFYDFISLQDKLGVVIADVADKGVHAALFMALSRSLVRASMTDHYQPADNLNRANSLIAADAPKGMFLTLFYAQFSPDGKMTYVNAGHNPPLYSQKGKDHLVEFEPTGIFLGLEAGIPLEQKTVEFGQGDFVILFTDGITEAMNDVREEFGEERLRELLLINRNGSAEDIRDAILFELDEFVGDTAQSDDITLVIARRK